MRQLQPDRAATGPAGRSTWATAIRTRSAATRARRRCGQTGACDGVGGCAKYAARDGLRRRRRAAGDRLNTAGTCDGARHLPRRPACRPARPSAARAAPAPRRCTSDADCVAGHACVRTAAAARSRTASRARPPSECEQQPLRRRRLLRPAPARGACRSCALPSVARAAARRSPPAPPIRAASAPTRAQPRCGTDGKCDGAGGCRKYRPGHASAPPSTATSNVYTPPVDLQRDRPAASRPTPIACAPFVCNGSPLLHRLHATTRSACRGQRLRRQLVRPQAERRVLLRPRGVRVRQLRAGRLLRHRLRRRLQVVRAAGDDGPLHERARRRSPTRRRPASTRAPPPAARNGKCEAGACQSYAQGTPCKDASCPASTDHPHAGVDLRRRRHVRRPRPPTSCFPFRCGVAACKSTCTADADCAPPGVCSNGSCGLKPRRRGLRRRHRVRERLLRAGRLLQDRLHRHLHVVRAAGSAGTCRPVAGGRRRSGRPVPRSGRRQLRHRRLLRRHRRLPALRSRHAVRGARLPGGHEHGDAGAHLRRRRDLQAGHDASPARPTPATARRCRGGLRRRTATASPARSATRGSCGNKRLGQICAAPASATAATASTASAARRRAAAPATSCNVAGSAGACQPVPVGAMEPHGGCAPAPPCGFNGTCDGGGALPHRCAAGTSCGTATCSGSTSTPVGACDGAGSCKQTPVSCAPYVCGTGACKTTCAANSDCVGGYTCQGYSCTNLKPNGSTCAAAGRMHQRPLHRGLLLRRGRLPEL